MRSFLVLIAAVCLAGCGSVDPAYTGKDAGTLVFGVGFETNNPYLDFQLQYRELQPSSPLAGTIRAKRSSLDASPPEEFGRSDPERGQVVIQHLKPGRYEIYGYRMSWPCRGFDVNICVESNELHASGETGTVSFSLPFTIEPGKTVYIGDYRISSFTDILWAPNPVIYVTDKSARDLEIARKRDRTLGEIRVAVPDAGQAGVRFLKPGPSPAG
jgi:hypothetical protein